MKKILYSIGIIALLSVGIGKALTDEQIIDEQLIKPLIEIILTDADTKLSLLTKQRVYIEKQIEAEIPQTTVLQQKKDLLLQQLNELEVRKNYYNDRLPGNLYKSYQEGQINIAIDELKAQLPEINKELEPARKLATMLNDIDFRINQLTTTKKNPVKYLFEALANVNIKAPHDMLDQGRAKNLRYHQDIYNEVNTLIKNGTDNEFKQSTNAGRWPLGYNSQILERLLQAKAAELALSIQNNWKSQYPFYNALGQYMQDVKENPNKANYRVTTLLSKAGPWFSLLEQAHMPSWSHFKNWLGNQWQAIKQYPAQFGQAWKQSTRNAMTPAHEYQLQRYQLGNEEPRPLQRDYGIMSDLKTRMQPRVQQMYKRWEPTIDRMQQRVDDMKPQFGQGNDFDAYIKAREYYGLDQ